MNKTTRRPGRSILFLFAFAGLFGCSGEAEPLDSNAVNVADTTPLQSTPAVTASSEEMGATTAPIPYDTSKYDILGISLGMPMEDAITAIENHTTSMKVMVRDGDVGAIYGARVKGIKFPMGMIMAGAKRSVDMQGRTLYANRESINVHGHLYPNNGTVSAIGRFSSFFYDPVLLTEMIALFTDKYGKPVFQEGYRISWSLKPDGSPQLDLRILDACSSGFTKKDRGPKMVAVVAYKSESNPGNYSQCGFTFIVDFSPTKSPEIVNHMTMTLYDFNEIKRSNEETIAYTVVEAEKMKAEELANVEGAKKPTL